MTGVGVSRETGGPRRSLALARSWSVDTLRMPLLDWSSFRLDRRLDKPILGTRRSGRSGHWCSSLARPATMRVALAYPSGNPSVRRGRSWRRKTLPSIRPRTMRRPVARTWTSRNGRPCSSACGRSSSPRSSGPLACAGLFAGPVWAVVLTAYCLLLATPVTLTMVAIYGGGYRRTFCIGAMFPAGILLLHGGQTGLAVLTYRMGGMSGSLAASDRLTIGITLGVAMVAVVGSGFLAVAVRRLVEAEKGAQPLCATVREED